MFWKAFQQKSVELLDRLDLCRREIGTFFRILRWVKSCQDQQQLQYLDADITSPDGGWNLI